MVVGVNKETDEESKYAFNALGKRIRREQKIGNNNVGYQNNNNYATEEYADVLAEIASGGIEAARVRQKTFRDYLGLTKQASVADVKTDYVTDYTSSVNNDIVAYEKGSYVTEYVYGNGNDRISQKVSHEVGLTDILRGKNPNTDVAVDGIGKAYFHENRLGSTAFVTDKNGEMLGYTEYDVWGKILDKQDSLNATDMLGSAKPRDVAREMNSAGIDDVRDYTGHNYDEVLEKYFAQARVYDPVNKRFMAEDEVNDGDNWYRYCENNPINYVDPTGNIVANRNTDVSLRSFYTYRGFRNNEIRPSSNYKKIYIGSKKPLNEGVDYYWRIKGGNRVAYINDPAPPPYKKPQAPKPAAPKPTAPKIKPSVKSNTTNAKDMGKYAKTGAYVIRTAGESVLAYNYGAGTSTINNLGMGIPGVAVEAVGIDSTRGMNSIVKTAYHAGEISGDISSAIIGAGAAACGVSGAIGGGTATVASGGLAAPASVPVTVGAVGVTVYGVGVVGVSAVNAGVHTSEIFESGKCAVNEIRSSGGFGGNGSTGSGSSLTPQEMNAAKSKVISGNNVHFKTKEDALDFIKKKFPGFQQEVAGGRSAEGWHFDSHPVNNSRGNIDHINIYSKSQNFRIHITWGD